MSVLGICIAYQAARPVVTGVALTGSRDCPILEQAFDLKTGSESIADQINDLVRALRSKIAGMDVRGCVIRVADYSKTPNNKAAPRNRLMIEGALVFACREQEIPSIKVLNGKEIGLALAGSKAEADVAGARLDKKKATAASAALVALNG